MIEKVSYIGKDYQKKAHIDNERKREPKIIPIELAETETFILELRADDQLILPSKTFVEWGQG